MFNAKKTRTSPFDMSPGLVGGKADQGGAPQLKGSAKDAQRRTEHKRDDAMHTSGMERAMGASADQLHVYKK